MAKKSVYILWSVEKDKARADKLVRDLRKSNRGAKVVKRAGGYAVYILPLK